jgi:alkanesulfonate monooxygenase SsuD/methylene tetrahydromethanopterin reductase-like flavin-dependent oxidoreductase (luciferase family)
MDNELAVSVLDLVGMRVRESVAARSSGRSTWRSTCSTWDIGARVLIGHVAAATKTIRVGSGGVMPPNHAPLVVAEQVGTLEALYPGRIDLGLGRAPGCDFQTTRALRRDPGQNGEDFPALLEELGAYLGPEKPGQTVKAIPGQGSNVPIPLLGSSGFRCTTGRNAWVAICICGALCSRAFARRGATVP